MKKNTLTLIITAILIITCSFLAIFFSEEKTNAYSESDPTFYYWTNGDDVYLYIGSFVYDNTIKIHSSNYSTSIPLTKVSGQQGVYKVDYGNRANARSLFGAQYSYYVCEHSYNYTNVNILKSSSLFLDLSISDENGSFVIERLADLILCSGKII